MQKPDFAKILEAVQQEFSFVNSTIKDKGAQRFSRPLAVAAIAVVGAYWLVYAPPGKKLADLDKKLTTAKATAKFADEYKDVRARLYAIYAVLPGFGAASLTANVVEACKLENIIPDGIDPPQEQEAPGLSIQSVTVKMTEPYEKIAAWLLRLEANRPLMHISSLELRKKGLGKTEATVVVTTIVPKVRF